MSQIFIFDLDETCINSNHRTPNFSDGTLDLQSYKMHHTPENVAKDTLLPLAKVLQDLVSRHAHVVILTARDMKLCDYDFLKRHKLINFKTLVLSRDRAGKDHYAMKDGEYKLHWLKKHNLQPQNCIIFDDAKPVKSVLRENGYTVLCGHKVNKKLESRK